MQQNPRGHLLDAQRASVPKAHLLHTMVCKGKVRSLLQSLCLGLCLTLSLGCDDASESATTPACAVHADCDLPERCIAGACRLECRVSSDCAPSQLCLEAVCVAPSGPCLDDSSCLPFGQRCDPQFKRCVNADQPATPIDQSSPVPLIDQGGAGAGGAGGAAGGGGEAGRADEADMNAAGASGAGGASGNDDGDLGTPRDQRAAPEPDQGPRGVYGDPCSCPADCESGFCVENKLRAMRTCTVRCEAAADCPGIDSCLQAQVQAGSGMCPPPPTSLPPAGTVVGVCAPNESGYPCSGPESCTEGICLTPPDPVSWASPQSVCSSSCTDDSRCPPGYRCGEAGGVAQRICIPATTVSPCPSGDPRECGGVCPAGVGGGDAASICLTFGGAQRDGYCSCSCESARDCPDGFACSRVPAIETGDPQRSGVCMAMAGYRCPESGMEEECLSLSCAFDEERPWLSNCISPCLRGADCPPQHRCLPFEGAGSYCVPLDSP